MIIKNLKLKNFRNLKDVNIDFSTDKDKKITIILGNNTFGKTTLVRSFVWCLYQENTFTTKILLNNDVAENLRPGETADVSAELTLDHNGYEYIIKTTETYEKARTNISAPNGVRTVVYKRNLNSISTDTDEVLPSKVKSEINSILDEDLKYYFFFDGETNTIEGLSEKAKLKEAVFNLMHMNETKAINDYFNPTKTGVVSKLRDEIQSDVETNLLDDIKVQLADLRDKKSQAQDLIDGNAKTIDGLLVRRKEYDDIISENQETKKYQDEKLDLEKKVSDCRKQIAPTFSNLIKSLNTSDALLKTLFAEAYTKYDLKDKLNNTSFNGENSYIGINEDAVNRLIENGECICGAKIENGNDAYRHLVEAKEHMEPHDYGRYVSDFISSEGSNVHTAKTIASGIQKNATSIIGFWDEIQTYNDRLVDVRKNITSDVDVGSYQRQINEIDSRVSYLRGQNSTSESNIDGYDKEIRALEDRQDREATKNDRNAFTKKCIAYATRIYELTDNDISRANEQIRSDLEKEVQDIFDLMYTGHRKITINPNFKAIPRVIDKSDADPSTGLTTVMNYSFVLGLMNLAKKSATEHRYTNEIYEDSDRPKPEYPLVMDAPFSSTDSDHIKNICSAMPQYCDQIIMVLMPKDYRFAYDSIKDRRGKVYQINKISETYSTIEEV